MNHALDVMAAESEAGAGPIDIIAVLDCDHVPLPTFLTATLGWFERSRRSHWCRGRSPTTTPAPSTTTGYSGEQGVFFHVLMAGTQPRRRRAVLVRLDLAHPRRTRCERSAGSPPQTIVEDMHTTLEPASARAGRRPTTTRRWRSVSPRPPRSSTCCSGDAGAWARCRSWSRSASGRRSGGCPGATTTSTSAARCGGSRASRTVRGVRRSPPSILLSGAQTSTAGPLPFAVHLRCDVRSSGCGARSGSSGMHLHWPTAFALRIFRVPVGMSCLWWLLTRRTLDFEVTPKAGADYRVRGPRLRGSCWSYGRRRSSGCSRTPLAGVLGCVPWQATPPCHRSPPAPGSPSPPSSSCSACDASRARSTPPRAATPTASRSSRT